MIKHPYACSFHNMQICACYGDGILKLKRLLKKREEQIKQKHSKMLAYRAVACGVVYRNLKFAELRSIPKGTEHKHAVRIVDKEVRDMVKP